MKPTLLALATCDAVTRDAASGKSFIGNFVFLQFGTYPFEVHSGPDSIGGRPFLVVPEEGGR